MVTDRRSKLERLARLGRNVMLDLKYGAFLGGSVPTRYGSLGSFNIVNSDYEWLAHIFRSIEIRESDVLVDVGCGKGRVINWWLSQRLKNRIIGVELDERVAHQTKERLRKHANVEIIQGNILDVLPGEGTIFYLYTPFDRAVLSKFRDLLMQPKYTHPRIAFVCSLGESAILDVFRDDAKWRIRDIPFPSSSAPYGRVAATLIDRVASTQS